MRVNFCIFGKEKTEKTNSSKEWFIKEYNKT